MWDNEATQRNITSLSSRKNYSILGPASGVLADGDVGAGRLSELTDIVSEIERLALAGPLGNKRVLITAGPTRESMDPVRFISNPSTGKMGMAMAHEARSLGAQVTVVLGPVGDLDVNGIHIIRVTTADEMLAHVMAHVNDMDCFVACAAVSDWKPEKFSQLKTKKSDGPETLTLVRTPDILKTASMHCSQKEKRPVFVGFAAETHDVVAYASKKMEAKNLDFMVANQVSSTQGFGTEDNTVTLLTPGFASHIFQGSKRQVAAHIWQHLVPKILERRS
jgi:phosphopantothenoylcysteine decarboxylase / phosphopantothenate---cysteine ligase